MVGQSKPSGLTGGCERFAEKFMRP